MVDESNHPIAAEETSEYINQFFSNIGPNLAKQLNHNINLAYEEYEPGGLEPLNILPISKNSLIDEIELISIYKSSGIKDISSRILGPL